MIERKPDTSKDLSSLSSGSVSNTPSTFQDTENVDSYPVKRMLSNLSKTLSHNIHSNEDNDTDALYKVLTEKSHDLERIKSNMEEGAGILGPLEQPIDLEKVTTDFQPEKDQSELTHEEDKWKYEIDEETGMRLVVFTDDDKENPRNWSSAYRCY
ncbi:unnamed protein product [Ambrosiozyma monospora]|uniref:Unnamed protein product n=1 Tax=Ambrosiozyma monospora TaxID=43982 RepID=A0ACB5TAH0_AMBMO|nr:unnamed protein product [Ambrosiozyma monospora]